jgi:hypothetical protein
VADKFLKGALVSFMPTFVGSLPNVIVFQYNPETMTHTWNPAAPPPAPKAGADPMAVSGLPGESFSFKLSLSARDMIADGDANPVAAALATGSGVSTRLAALEMLLFPSGAFAGGLVGTVTASVGASGLSLSAGGGSSSANSSVPRSEVPTVLFVWGPQRILPVRVTSLSVTETLYDALLNPIQADASITLRVLTPDELASVTGELKQVALVAYNYSQGLRQAQAVANLGDAAAAIIGMLPSPF